MNFEGKVVIVTGGGNGIGRAVCRGFSTRGGKVVVVDHDADSARKVADEIVNSGGKALAIAADVTNSADVAGYVETAIDAFGRIDCFHNNAGTAGAVAPIVDCKEDQFDAIMAVNVKGVYLGLRCVLPIMIQQKYGSIVNTCSIQGNVGAPNMSLYVASKHAVLGLTRSAAGEVARHGVRVNAISPGPVDTRMIHSLESMISPDDPSSVAERYHASIPLGRYSTTEEIANSVLFLMSDLSSGTTGTQLVVDGGRTAVTGVTLAGRS